MKGKEYLEDSLRLQTDSIRELTKALESLLSGYEKRLDRLVDTLIENNVRDKEIIDAVTEIMAAIPACDPAGTQAYARFSWYRRIIFPEIMTGGKAQS